MGSTFRLKRKLQEQGVDLSSRRATENFCLIGTPLPPLEKSRDTGEYVPLWKQDVRDEKGRRRLHGAFTGGFSAGYFNTVGSAEGWAPKSFVSSRSERAKQKAARPEDYMDEEDLVELRESQVMDKFGKQEGLGGTEAELRKRGAVEEEEDDSLAKSLREALIPAGEDTPGMKLLRKMGWRPGQGVGPRVTWRQRKVQDLLAAGKSLNDIDIDALEDDEEAKKHMYPPRDTVATRHGRKEDKHGLGYVGQLGLQESLGQKRKGPSGPSLSAGFGLGALNEAEEDDIDVYDSSARGERTHMAFDASDPDAEDRFALKRSQARVAGAPRMLSAGLQRFDDGTPVATGFILADKPSFDMRRFPLPEVPAGWKPNPRRVWEKAQGKENVEVADKYKDVAAAWRNKLTPGERGAMLGETPLPSAPRSVFEYLSQKDRERIQHAAATFKAAPSEARPTAEAEVDIHMLPFTPANTAEAALKGFMPFAGDPAKQARYTAYLRSQANPEQRDAAPPRLPGQSAGDYHKEMADFAKSAALFRPVSGAMASRFTSAAVVDAGPQIVEGLHQPMPEAKRTDEERLEAVKEEESRREEEVEGSRGHAVRFGMYGPLTREVRAWQPAKLLCKRFGVKEPEVEVTTETPMPGTAAAAAGGGWKPEEALAEAGVSVPGPSLISAGEEGGNGGKKRRDLDNIGLGEDDEQGKDILTYVRPPMDIFKAIFADEESEEEGEEEPKVDVGMKGPQPQPQPEAGPSRTQPETVPVHLLARADTNRNAAYEPSSSSSDVNGAAPVDLATFKPTFVPRAERDAHKAKDKDRKKKDKDKGVVSFAMEEDGEDGGALHIAPRRKSEKSRDGSKKKKRRKEEMAAESAWDDMWVEKAPPEVVKALDVSGSMMPIPETGERGVEVGPPRGRKRAVDFMED